MANNELNTIIEGCSICVLLVVGGGGAADRVHQRGSSRVSRRRRDPRGVWTPQRGAWVWLGPALAPVGSAALAGCLTGWGREQVSGWKNPKPLWSPESQSSSTRADPVRGRWKARDTAGLAECLAHLGTCPVLSLSSEEGVKTHSLIFPVHYLCISAFGGGIYCIKNSRKKLRKKKKFYWTRILNLCKTFLNWGLIIGNLQIGN